MISKQPIIPSILTDKPDVIARELEFCAQVGNAVHIDVVDKIFAQGQTLSIDDWPKLMLDYVEAHLMVEKPLDYLEKLKEKNVTRAIIHIESSFDLSLLTEKARSLDILLGFAISPDTDLDDIKKITSASNYVQVMGVYPGKSGQTQLGQTPLAVAYLHRLPGHRLSISVDGGVNEDNIPILKQAGARYFIGASALFKSPNWQEEFNNLVTLANNDN
jgi:ribulose-phosphate 3-epimerase